MSKPIKYIFYKFLLPILVSLAVRILSLQMPQKDYKSKPRVATSKVASLTQKELLKPLLEEDVKPKLDWRELLAEAERKGKPIKPVKHRKPYPYNEPCPGCNAPPEYHYNNAEVSPPGRKGKVQKAKCKVCGRQWYPTDRKETLYCPYCQGRLDLKKRRKDYDVLKCINPDCPYKAEEDVRFSFHRYNISLEPLHQLSSLEPKVDFTRTQFSHSTILTATSLFIKYKLSSRLTSQFLFDFHSVEVSHQSVLNWVDSLATLFWSNINAFPVHFSSLWVADETYLRYEGKWGYLFTILNGTDGSIISQFFSQTRSTQGAYIALYLALKKFPNIPPDFTIDFVSDGLSSYPPALQLISSHFNLNFNHIPVIGLSDPDSQPKNEYRPFKNLIENFYSVLKPFYYKYRGFSSKRGAFSFCVLFTIYYNYLHLSDRFDDSPLIPLPNLDPSHSIPALRRLVVIALAA